MKKIHKGKQQLLFALFSVLVLLISVCLLQSCQPDGKMVKSGTFGLRLSADTTSLNKGVNSDLKTKGYEDEFEEFLETSDYSILIVKDQQDTVQTFPRYDEMPAEIELAEGAYTLIASKGDNKGAAFENPYFEGSTDFTIRGDMNTYIDVTCTLGNTRVVTESSKEFDDVYEDYTIVIKTPYTSEDGFEIEKGETSPAFFRADKEGTEAEVVVKLKKKGSTEEESFSSTAPLILERRQNVNIMLKLLEGNQGIGLEVTLDDSMVEIPMDYYIPDYMWGEHDKPVLIPETFKDGDKFTLENEGVSDDKDVTFFMSGGINSLCIKYWEQNNKDNYILYDLTKESDVKLAKNAYISWIADEQKDVILTNKHKYGLIKFKDAINSLKRPEEGKYVYYFEIYGSDATGKHYETDTVRFAVEANPAGAPVIVANQETFSETEITEGDNMTEPRVMTYSASAGIDENESYLQISDGQNTYKYLVMSDDDINSLKQRFDIHITKNDANNAVVSFPQSFSSKLTAPEGSGFTTYTYTFYLKDKQGKTAQITRELKVYSPEFTLDITDGNAFAKRVYLRGQLTKGTPDKLAFLQNGTLITPKVSMLEDGTTYEAVATGLDPNKSYKFQAVYNSMENRKSEVKTVTTEIDNTFVPNAGFEDWEEKTISNLLNGANIFVGKVSLTAGCPKQGWSVINDKTFVTEANIWSTYNTVPSTLKCEGMEGNGALLRTVGWDNGAGNSAISLYHVAAGKLFLGTYSYNHENNTDTYNYGYDFTSRPSRVNFNYKYTPYKDDSFKAWIVVLNRENGKETVLGKGEIINGDNVSSWSLMSIPIIYTNLEKKATHYYIVFSSSSRCSEIESEETSNLKSYVSNVETGGYTHYEGSNLYIDNVQLIYE